MAKSIISTTYSDTYLYFLPIVTYCWGRLGVDVICFLPHMAKNESERQKYLLAMGTSRSVGNIRTYMFDAPEHKQATYSQCSRLYGACLDLPEDEMLITGDIDMAMFKVPPYIDKITIFGSDLVPDGQLPMCYASGTVKEWRNAMKLYYGALSEDSNSLAELKVKTYQQCLDELLGEIECEHMRGNYWCKDQQTLWENTKDNTTLIPRARPNTQFADNRVDRDDINWRSYVNENLVDTHLWRDGYTDDNFANILELLTMKYPQADFTWLIDYTNAYKKLL